MLQSISLIYIMNNGRLNGDFIAFSSFNMTVVMSSFITSFIPFFLVFLLLRNQAPLNNSKVNNQHVLSLLLIGLLLLNIFFSVKYQVGRLAADKLYQVPFMLKPFIVMINRVDIYMLSTFVLVNPAYRIFHKRIIVLLLIVWSLSKASIFVFLYLILIWVIRRSWKLSLKPLIVIASLFLFMAFVMPYLYELRQAQRGGNDVQIVDTSVNEEVVDFVFGKVLGRVSNLSAIVYFQSNINDIISLASTSFYFDYIIEFFQPLWGSFYAHSYQGYTYLLTNYYDPSAASDYGIMYGLNVVFILSYYKGFLVFLLNSFFFLVILWLIIRLARNIFLEYYTEVILIALFMPLLSGVPSELGNLLINLCILFLLKFLYSKILLPQSFV